MFDDNWSTEAMARTLGGKYGPAGGGFGRREEAPGGSPVREMAQVIDKMSDLLETQGLFRAEIDSLRREVLQLRSERTELDQRYTRQVASMQEELRILREERARMLQELLEYINSAGAHAAPPEAFARLPLVIRKNDAEFLGVAAKGGHFSLREFIRIIERNGSTRKSVALAWRREPGIWVLTINTFDLDMGHKHEHVLHLRQTVTPSQNNVVELTHLCIDGQAVPEPFLLVLLRKIKDGFEAQG